MSPRQGRLLRRRQRRKLRLLRRPAAGAGADIRETVRERYAAAARAPPTQASRPAAAARSLCMTRPARRSSATRSTTTPRPTASPTPPSPRRWAAACRPPSPTCTRARPCSTSAPAPAPTCSSRRRRVGPTGKAIGLDMTDEMLELARSNAARGRRRERRVRQGLHRGDPAARRQRRRGHLQLRHQPLRRQGAGAARGRAGAAPRRALRRLRRHRRRGHGRGDPRRHGAVDRLHRRRADPRRVRGRAGRPPGSSTSRSARRIACTTTPRSAIIRARKPEPAR